jgi:hypothetical protein
MLLESGLQSTTGGTGNLLAVLRSNKKFITLNESNDNRRFMKIFLFLTAVYFFIKLIRFIKGGGCEQILIIDER